MRYFVILLQTISDEVLLMAVVKIDRKKCTDCGICVDICPVGVFGFENGKVVVKDSSKCILCRTCQIHCPEDAIYVEE